MKPSLGSCGIDLPSLLETRLLVQANSGGGKSYCLRRLLEQTATGVQQIVIDPEGEFATLREKFDFIVCAPQGADAVATPRELTADEIAACDAIMDDWRDRELSTIGAVERAMREGIAADRATRKPIATEDTDGLTMRDVVWRLERIAGNTDTDPRWLAAQAIRALEGWESFAVHAGVAPEAARASMSEDAARYRWLRKTGGRYTTKMGREVDLMSEWNADVMAPDKELNEAIDTARSAK